MYSLRMFKEDIRLENMKQHIDILRHLDEQKKARMMRLLYFYQVNSKDDINS